MNEGRVPTSESKSLFCKTATSSPLPYPHLQLNKANEIHTDFKRSHDEVLPVTSLPDSQAKAL